MRLGTLFSLVTFALLGFRGPSADAAGLELTSPVGSESWAVGSSHGITWKSTLPAGVSIRIEWSRAGGDSWTEIASAAPNNGRFVWAVPESAKGGAVLRLTAKTGETATSKGFSIVDSQAVDYVWTNVTMKADWAPRDGAGALIFKNRFWFLGGWNPAPAQRSFFPRICNNEVWSSADGVSWTLEKPNTFKDAAFDPASDWEGRHTAGYAVYKDKMWIIGGDANQGHYQSDVWNSADGKVWNYVNKGKPVPWGPRALHCTAVFKDKIWVIGGQTMPAFAGGPELFYRDIWTTTDGVEWTKLEPKEPYWPQRGMIGGSVVLNDRLWILGGGTYDTPTIKTRQFMNDVWSTADGVNWTQHVDAAPWHPRQYHDVAAYDGRMWVMEGYHANGGNRKDVWYSKDGVNWYEVANTPWNPRHAASVYVFNDALWMVSGNNMEKDVWKLTRKDSASK